MRFIIIGALIAGALFAEPRGPYAIEIPMRGLTPAHQEAAEKLLMAMEFEWGGVYNVRTGQGVLALMTGARSESFLLYLSEIQAVVAELDLDFDLNAWVLKPQMMAFVVSAGRALSVAGIRPVLPGVRSVLAVGDRTLLVVELDTETEYVAIRESLEGIGVQIDDLVWGHWRDGWGIDTARVGSHIFGARHGG